METDVHVRAKNDNGNIYVMWERWRFIRQYGRKTGIPSAMIQEDIIARLKHNVGPKYKDLSITLTWED